MNNYIITQKDIDILMQSDKMLFYKLELLNSNMNVLDCIEGNLISDSLSISADSDIRRTYNCTLYVENSSFNLKKDSIVFFDKMVRPYIGIFNQRHGVIWYCLGTYLYTDLNYSYDESNKTLQITCLDLMCLLNDSRRGQIPDYQRNILASTDARELIINLLGEAGINKYFIEFNLNGKHVSTFSIPHDMTYNAGSTIYNIIRDVVQLYAGTQMYFSVDGTFVIEPIPTGKNEINMLTDDIIQPLLISEQLTTSLSNVYNHIKIYGKVNEPNYYTKDVTCVDNVYKANVIAYKLDETGTQVEVDYGNKLNNFDSFSLRIPQTNSENQYLNINGIDNIPIVDDSGKPIRKGLLEINTDYIFRYRRLTNDFLFLGSYQCYGEAFLSNKSDNTNEYAVIDTASEFAIEVIGDRVKVLTGSDFDNIYSNGLCTQRARLELYKASNLQDSLSLSTALIPWLDVNMKVEFTSNITKQKKEYIITNISCDNSTYQMTISLSSYYPDYI